MLLTALTDDEFLRHAQAQHDTLLSSPIETELLRRFEKLVDHGPLVDVLDEHSLLDIGDLKSRLDQPCEWANKNVGELTDLLDSKEVADLDSLTAQLDMAEKAFNVDLDTPDALEKALDDLRRINAAFNDLAEPLKTLADLAATATA